MSEIALGALLGLGLFVLVSGSTASRLVTRLAPHVRDVTSVRVDQPVADGAVRVLALIAATPRTMFVDRRRRRQTRRAVSDELPGVLDLIGLCVSTGMTIPESLERVGRVGRGVLPEECRHITSELALGVSVTDALHGSQRRVAHEGWSRLVEHLDIARRHGTPLVDIIRSLSDDEQHAAGQRLVESASARETLMMFPLVFVILPVTVIMAIFPGVTALGSVVL